MLPEKIRKGEPGRWLIALALAIPTLIAIFAENKLFVLVLVFLVGAFAWWEYSANLLGRNRTGLFLISLLGWAAVSVGTTFAGPEGQAAGLVFALVLGGFYLMWILNGEDKIALNLIARYGFGHLYLSFFLSFALLIKTFDRGANFLFFVILATSLADTGAIYAGSRLKGPKLCPKISPNKTISGLLGGCALAAITGALSKYYLPDEFSMGELTLVGLG
ncbi:MAG: phosphatidate cytidylyltransferase, partial [Deltaproteobacteria bacterium]|nr:phosphatidate cytidylyltransferase [Deltaproteobacteria bacterium]